MKSLLITHLSQETNGLSFSVSGRHNGCKRGLKSSIFFLLFKFKDVAAKVAAFSAVKCAEFP